MKPRNSACTLFVLNPGALNDLDRPTMEPRRFDGTEVPVEQRVTAGSGREIRLSARSATLILGRTRISWPRDSRRSFGDRIPPWPRRGHAVLHVSDGPQPKGSPQNLYTVLMRLSRGPPGIYMQRCRSLITRHQLMLVRCYDATFRQRKTGGHGEPRPVHGEDFDDHSGAGNRTTSEDGCTNN